MSYAWITTVKSKLAPRLSRVTPADTDYIKAATEDAHKHALAISELTRVELPPIKNAICIVASLIPPNMCEAHEKEAASFLCRTISRCDKRMLQQWLRAPASYGHPLFAYLKSSFDSLKTRCEQHTQACKRKHEIVDYLIGTKLLSDTASCEVESSCNWAIPSGISSHDYLSYPSVNVKKEANSLLCTAYLSCIIHALLYANHTKDQCVFPCEWTWNLFESDEANIPSMPDIKSLFAEYLSLRVASTEKITSNDIHAVIAGFYRNSFPDSDPLPYSVNMCDHTTIADRTSEYVTSPHHILPDLVTCSLYASIKRITSFNGKNAQCPCDDSTRRTYSLIKPRRGLVAPPCPLSHKHTHPKNLLISGPLSNPPLDWVEYLPRDVTLFLIPNNSAAPVAIPLRQRTLADRSSLHKNILQCHITSCHVGFPKGILGRIASSIGLY